MILKRDFFDHGVRVGISCQRTGRSSVRVPGPEVAARTMLAGGEFPTCGDVNTMLALYPDVKPDPAKVDEYREIYCRAWDRRFGEDDERSIRAWAQSSAVTYERTPSVSVHGRMGSGPHTHKTQIPT